MVLNNKDLGLIIKFVEERYVKSTLEGNLYFSSIKYFRRYDNQFVFQNVGDVFDSNEGKDEYIMKTNMAYVKIANDSQVYSFPIEHVKISFDLKKTYGICSFMYLNFYDDFCEDKEVNKSQIRKDWGLKDNNFKVIKIKDEVIKQLQVFQDIEEEQKGGKCLPLVFQASEFWKLIRNPKKHLGYGLVQYHDFSKEVYPDKIPDYSNVLDAAILFNKDVAYKNQRELRLVKNIASDKTGQIFDFKDLRGYVAPTSIGELKCIRYIEV